ncbi:MAG: serine hydrolase [Trichococcus flocculiformis]|jgi:beta-lactamase class A|nr:serine hydrolase [Trichococcus sp.]MBP6247780.1 serine hydrolase [Trichococcus sp.]MBP7129069.1 serine hydrolase [Trichococcus sp.]MBP8683204.1 serine hydrolase [Trichococcus sp.]MBP9977296.1 serine hydrolase [Trichococcus sp.]
MKKRKRLKKKYSFLLTTLFLVGCVTFLLWDLANSQEGESAASAQTLMTDAAYEADEMQEADETSIAEANAILQSSNLLSASGEDLAADLDELNAAYPDQLGFVLINEQTGEAITTNESRIFTSASLYKLFLTYAILEQVDAGVLSLQDQMADGATIDDYLTSTITVSANEPAKELAHLIGWENIETFIHEQGFVSTSFNPYLEYDGIYYNGDLETTPAEVAFLLERLLEGELLSEASTKYFLGLLGNQQLVYALNTGLSSDVTFAHKTGLLDDVSHDAGILSMDGQNYIVAVLTDGWLNATDDATPVFEEIGSAVMTYLYAQ